MNKYIIRESIEWEGYNQWTVFADNEDAAIIMVKTEKTYTGRPLQVKSTRSVKGRKYDDIGIYKFISKFEQ